MILSKRSRWLLWGKKSLHLAGTQAVSFKNQEYSLCLSNFPLGLSVTQPGCEYFRAGVYFLIGLTMMPGEVAKYEINMDLKAQT